MTNKPAIAVIGCGGWGRNHARTLRDLGVLAAVADIKAETAREASAAFGAPARDAGAILADPNIDAVILALPPQLHADQAVAALRAGKHVLVEKPIALKIEDAQRVVVAAEEAGRVVMTGHVLRFHPAFERLQEMIDAGELGQVKYLHSHRLGLGNFHSENDALWDIAPHDLSLILAITGEEPSVIRGEGSAVLDHLSDFAHLHLHFPSGIQGHVFASRLNPYRERQLTVVGDAAMAVFDDVAPWERKLAIYRHRVWNADGQWRFENVDAEYIPVPEDLPLTRELRHFIACIETGAQPRTGAAEGLSVLRILAAGTVHHVR